MESVRRLWPFRNLANFSLTIIGISGFGLLFQSIRNERVFSRSPVITESLKVLSSNDSIRNLLGLPIQYNATFSNSYTLGEVEQYYNFQVKGNKSSTSTQLSASKMKVGEINKIINHSVDLSNQVNQKEQQYTKLLQQNKKIKKKEEISKATEVANKLLQQLTKLKVQADEAQKKRVQIVSKFYIPEEELYQKIVRNKTPSEVISQEEYLHGIGGLIANLPNRNMICVVPQNENEAKKIYSQKQKYLVPIITQGYLGTRLKEKERQLSQNQIESYGKHKTNLMYGKYSSYRIGFVTILMIAGASGIVYFDKYRFRGIGGTFIAKEAEEFLFSHPKFRSILNQSKNKKNIKNVKFSNLFEGGRNGDRFRTSVNIQGIKGLKIHFEGTVSKNNKVNFKKFELEEQNGKKTDLIV